MQLTTSSARRTLSRERWIEPRQIQQVLPSRDGKVEWPQTGITDVIHIPRLGMVSPTIYGRMLVYEKEMACTCG